MISPSQTIQLMRRGPMGMAGALTPSKGLPNIAARPNPNSVSASPDATWLARNSWVSAANSSDMVAPAKAATANPRNGLPLA